MSAPRKHQIVLTFPNNGSGVFAQYDNKFGHGTEKTIHYMKSRNNYINDAIKYPRYCIMYQGKEIKRYPFYKQARDFCILHNHGKDSLPFPEIEDRCELLDLQTGEILNTMWAKPSQ